MRLVLSRWMLALMACALGQGCGPTLRPLPDGAVVDAGSDVRVGSTRPTLAVNPASYAFPKTVVGETSPAVRFKVTNSGPVAIDPVSAATDWRVFAITASTCGQALAPGESCEVEVVFQPAMSADYRARLTFVSPSGAPLVAQLSGIGLDLRVVRLQPERFMFPETKLDPSTSSMPQVTFTLSNPGDVSVGPFIVDIDGRDARDFLVLSGSTCGGSGLLSPRGQCMIAIGFRPTTAGPKEATLRFRVGEGVAATAMLLGTGAPPPLSLRPAAQNFGAVTVGQETSFTFQLENVSTRDSPVPSISVVGFSALEFRAVPGPACASPLAPGATCPITVTMAPTTAGLKIGILRVQALPASDEMAELVGSGVAAGGLFVTSAVPDPFGTVMVGESSSASLVVQNRSNLATGPVMTVLQAADFMVAENSCPASLAPEASCALTVKFSPLTTGRRTAALEVRAAPGGSALLPLSGQATAGRVAISPISWNFGVWPAGDQTGPPREFVVSLSGSGPMTGPLSVAVEGDPLVFPFVLNECQGASLSVGQSCRMSVRFTPRAAASHSSSLVVSANPGGVVRSTLTGTGH